MEPSVASTFSHIIWHKEVPLKVSLFVRRLLCNRFHIRIIYFGVPSFIKTLIFARLGVVWWNQRNICFWFVLILAASNIFFDSVFTRGGSLWRPPGATAPANVNINYIILQLICRCCNGYVVPQWNKGRVFDPLSPSFL